MTKEQKITVLKARAMKIVSRGKYIDFPGALKKVRRQIRSLEKEND